MALAKGVLVMVLNIIVSIVTQGGTVFVRIDPLERARNLLLSKGRDGK